MEKVITNELTKFLIILGALTLALTVLLARMVNKIKAAFKPHKKETILYVLVAAFFFGIIAVMVHPSIVESPVTALILFQAWFLLLGAAHVYYMSQYMQWMQSGKPFYLNLVFTLLLAILGSVVFMLVYQWVNRNDIATTMTGGILFFMVPFLFFQTFRTAIGIPPKILKEWFYPVDQEIEEPDDAKLKNLLVISFEFRKQVGDQNVTNFRAKAPADMEFGQLFYYFINDYNERHPDAKVQFMSSHGQPHGWVFYKKPRWTSLLTQYVDAEKTVFNNRIRENDVIICARLAQ